MHSLRSKIALGYFAVGMLAVVLVGLALHELRDIEVEVHGGERVAELFDAVMEIRRFEKNLFLYGQPGDLAEAVRYLALARALFDGNQPVLTGLAATADIDGFRSGLDHYGTLLATYARLPTTSDPEAQELERAVRAQGKDLVAIAKAMADRQRGVMQRYLDRERANLIAFGVVLAGLVVVVGLVLAKVVTRPLASIERSIATIAEKGAHAEIPVPSRDREIVSLTGAFNQLLREVEARRRELVFAEKLASLGTLISGVAHELNNPLSNISTSVQIVAEELEDGDIAFKREMLDQIEDQTQRARRIVQSLLEYARQRDIEREPVPVAALMRDTFAFLRAQLPAHLTVAIAVPDGLSVSVDRHRIQQVFLNLLRNAADAVGDGGHVTLAARAVTPPLAGYLADIRAAFPGPCTPQGPVVEITVADDGPGIDPEHLERIFDPFFTTKDVNRGAGLGLFVAYEVVRQHRGCIGVRSAPGQGTTFIVLLPAAGAEVLA